MKNWSAKIIGLLLLGIAFYGWVLYVGYAQ